MASTNVTAKSAQSDGGKKDADDGVTMMSPPSSARATTMLTTGGHDTSGHSAAFKKHAVGRFSFYRLSISQKTPRLFVSHRPVFLAMTGA